jgi:hypothetical protein
MMAVFVLVVRLFAVSGYRQAVERKLWMVEVSLARSKKWKPIKGLLTRP